MPVWVELAQRTEGTGNERTLRSWMVGPRLAMALPACYGARGERALIEVWVHRCRLLRKQVGRSVGWIVDERRHRRSRGHRKRSLGNGRLGRFVEENRDKRPWWMTTSRPMR